MPGPLSAEFVMRISALVSLTLVLSPCLADDAVSKPVTPAEAAKLIDKKVTVEMAVKSTGKSRGVFFLNSEEDYRSESNFTAFINATGAKRFHEAKIDDPAAHFKGKTVRVTGTVTLYRDKPEIVVEDPKQVEIVEKPERP
jgi:DNA/RNA endonuclease YhcR with UshA esterase domain